MSTNNTPEHARINQLQALARAYHSKMITESEIEQNDITEIFFNEIPYIIEHEIPNFGITGKTKGSKSTTMMYIVDYILKNYYGVEIEMKHILDQLIVLLQTKTINLRNPRILNKLKIIRKLSTEMIIKRNKK